MQSEEEVSLIDLLAIILRYRYLIISLTVVSALVSGYLFVLSPRITAVRSGLTDVHAETLQVILPAPLMNEIGLDPTTLAQNMAQDREMLLNLAKNRGLELDEIGYSVTRMDVFSGHIFKLIFSARVKDGSQGILFLKDVVNATDERLREYIAQRSVIIARSMEGLYASAPPMTELSKMAERVIISSNIYVNSDLPVLKLVSEPTAYQRSYGDKKRALLLTSAAFFTSIVLAFLFEYIRRIKSDPISMGKLSEALKGKKRNQKNESK